MSDLTVDEILSDGYCAGCNSFGHTEQKECGIWCNLCWEWRLDLPSSVRKIIMDLEHRIEVLESEKYDK